MTSTPVRVAVVGLGRLGHTHAENAAWRIPSLELVRVVDALEPVAHGMGERLGVPWTTSYAEALADPAVEAVVLVTPTPLHVAMIEQAAAAGKHVFCEKPVAFDVASTERAIDAAQAAGIKLQIGFHRHFDPNWLAAYRRIASGDLGKIYLFRSTMRDMQPPSLDYLRTSGGLFMDMTIHELDAARWLVGEVDEVSAMGTVVADPAFETIGDIDHGVVTLRFANGALGVIDSSRAAGYGYECATEVLGSKATVRVAPHRRVHVEWLTPDAATRDYVADFAEQFPEAYVRELEAFAAAARDEGPVLVTGEDGLGACVLALAAERSRQQGRPVPLRRRAADGRTRYAFD